ncbi:glyoxylase-like metal-dependent hydrolase (beta-lactamase superfamily II) [Bacillus niacini]|uniref:Glyoxylase-like metal-dependent hydrolase (Beta-lactamase superfamily II) n=1 Tax=Neobacillus niacini TaxID=86668 RepID=A0A852TMD7_9BACI|nr:MBL fold metallo-hydrolase [Neobacillus niacini]NYE09549.1 glyoxylase-like metal-dependent hydrolase (beta-lactamase superfamily II) [Neobacillus niacini]
MFDTFNTPQAAEDLKVMAEEITNRTVTWVVNSHWHGDHIRGNQAYKDSIIISSQLTYEKMRDIHPSRIGKQKNDIQGLTTYIQSLQEQLAASYDSKLEEQISFLGEIEASLPYLELTLPRQTFINELTFYGSKRSAKLYTLGGGHSDCDSILYIPDENAIFMGDLLFVDTHPTIFEDSNPAIWVQILERVKEIDFVVAIPGHGPVGTKRDLSKLIEYIIDITKMARTTNEEIAIPEKYQNWSSSEIFHQNISGLSQKVKLINVSNSFPFY